MDRKECMIVDLDKSGSKDMFVVDVQAFLTEVNSFRMSQV